MTQPASIALITGASSGIGAAFARLLAARGHNLILVARRRDRLENLAHELKNQHGCRADVLVADLSSREEIERVAAHIAGLGHLDLLVNNAGFGINRPLSESDPSQEIAMIDVHVTASVRLTQAALPGMIAQRQGGIINLASISAFLPTAGMSTYVASKSYLLAFCKGLQIEVQKYGIQVQALCPGFTYTEMHDTPAFAGRFERSSVPKIAWMRPEQVARASLRALDRGQVVFIPGLINRLIIVSTRLMPRELLNWIKRTAVARKLK